MAAQKHHEAPGTPQWHARRARCWNAGDAPAMLGCSSHKTRTDLLHEVHIGLQREFSDYVQERVIDPGHAVEAAMRPLAEDVLGEDLTVLAYSLQVAGLTRPLGASLDGILFLEDCAWECKSLNDALRAAMPHAGRDSHAKNDARALPKMYRVQVEQQLLVTGAQRALFSAGRIGPDGEVLEERHAFYVSDPALRAEIIAGWKQFEADLAAYTPTAAVEKIVAEPVPALPAVSVKVEGSIVIRENFDAFEKAARDFLDNRLIRQPKTDQDFADLDVQIKAMKSAEAALEAAEAGWIAQIESVGAAKRRKDLLHKLVRDNRLMAERLLKDEKERRRGEIVAGAVAALQQHVAALNKRIVKPYMPTIPADFGNAIKGLRSLASMEDAVATELARAKIAANEVADRIEENLKALAMVADRAFLFADERTLVLKAPDDLQATIAARVVEHERKEEERLERERARIRAEEEARARAQAAREQQEREAAERRQREEQQALERQQREATVTPAQAPTQAPAPAANVHPMPTRAPAPPTQPTLMLREINARLQHFTVTADGLRALGFEPAARQGSALMYHEADWPAICDAIVDHVTDARDARKAA